MNWQPIDTAPEGVEIMTKIDDEKGERNVQCMTKRVRELGCRPLWFAGEMYVYYEPTHWSAIKHIPGPYKLASPSHLFSFPVIVDEGGNFVAAYLGSDRVDRTSDQVIATLTMLAAAPDMLEALERMADRFASAVEEYAQQVPECAELGFINSDSEEYRQWEVALARDRKCLDVTRAIIAKAKGEAA